jgi:hypothetical protein
LTVDCASRPPAAAIAATTVAATTAPPPLSTVAVVAATTIATAVRVPLSLFMSCHRMVSYGVRHKKCDYFKSP